MAKEYAGEHAEVSGGDPRLKYLFYPQVRGLLNPQLQHVLDEQTPGSGAGVPMDAVRRDDALVLLFDMPGVDASAIKLSVNDRILTVSAIPATPLDEEGAEVLVAERFHGLRTRRVFIGSDLDTDEISATYAIGLLRVVIPVRETSLGHWVEVDTGSEAEPSDPPIHMGTTDIPEEESELRHDRQNAASLDSVAQDLLSGTFPKAADADVHRAATILAGSVMRDVAAGTVDIEEAQSTARELADLLGHRPTN